MRSSSSVAEKSGVSIGDVSKDMTVLSPARPDLADGTRVRMETVPTRQVPDAPLDVAPAADPAPAPAAAAGPAPVPEKEAAAVAVSAADADNAVISAAISAHVDSVVNDARRNVGKYR